VYTRKHKRDRQDFSQQLWDVDQSRLRPLRGSVTAWGGSPGNRTRLVCTQASVDRLVNLPSDLGVFSDHWALNDLR
jgi:hypothetical protein